MISIESSPLEAVFGETVHVDVRFNSMTTELLEMLVTAAYLQGPER